MKKILSAFLLSAALGSAYAQHSPDSTQQKQQADNRISIIYDYTKFDKQFSSDWQVGSVEYLHRRRSGTYIGRFNYGNRFDRSGGQVEIEAYPRISKRFYGYVGMGLSSDFPVFPKFNAGASLFVNLPGAFEADAGFRYLNFDNNTWVYTGSAGKYAGNFWFNLRTYVTPGSDHVAQSHIFTTRYYFKSADDYLSLILGSGFSPDDRSQAVQLNSKYRLKSQRGALGYKFSFSKNVVFIQASIANVEYLQDMKDKQLNIMMSYQRKF